MWEGAVLIFLAATTAWYVAEAAVPVQMIKALLPEYGILRTLLSCALCVGWWLGLLSGWALTHSFLEAATYAAACSIAAEALHRTDKFTRI